MRGMKKWLPFKSLSGQYDMLDKMKSERNKVAMPELSVDQIDELNRVLVSLQKGDQVEVVYFQEGEILRKRGIFLRCDGYNQKVFFKGFVLPFNALLRFEN
ncbi:MAG: YolD-like family protein [Bacilli bacterium]|nr:YolD-like family protein [Bacilli bacterium]